MPQLLRTTAFVFLLSACGAPALAQTAAARDEEERAALLSRITQHPSRKPAEQKSIYELGKEYLRKYGDRPQDEADALIIGYIRRWVVRYELAVNKYYRSVLPRLTPAPRAVCRRRDP